MIKFYSLNWIKSKWVFIILYTFNAWNISWYIRYTCTVCVNSPKLGTEKHKIYLYVKYLENDELFTLQPFFCGLASCVLWCFLIIECPSCSEFFVGISWQIKRKACRQSACGKWFLFFFFWPRRATCSIPVPRPGKEPAPPTLEARSLNHWTTREVPRDSILNVKCDILVLEGDWKHWRNSWPPPRSLRSHSCPLSRLLHVSS